MFEKWKKCPVCDQDRLRVIDSREISNFRDIDYIWCENCGATITYVTGDKYPPNLEDWYIPDSFDHYN